MISGYAKKIQRQANRGNQQRANTLTRAYRAKVSGKPAPSGGGKGGKKGGGGGGALWDPSSLLSGKKLKHGANALTRIELTPALKAYTRDIGALQAQETGAQQGLQALGDRTAGAVGGAYDALKGSSAQTSARQQVIANMLNTNTQNIAQQGQQALTNAQTGQLGDLTEALTARNVPPGGSASQQALAQQVQAQQQAAAQRATGYQQFASSQGASMAGLANAEGQAEQMRGREAQAGVHQAIADRVAQSNSDYGSSISEALGKRADTKALWGPTRLKNLLQLRGSERDQMSAVASLGGMNKRAQLSAQTSRLNNQRSTSTSRQNSVTSAKTSKRNSVRSSHQSDVNSRRSQKGQNKRAKKGK